MLKQIILISSFILGIVVLLMYFFQRNLIYFPDRHKPQLKNFHADDMSVINLHTRDKIKLTSWYKPSINNQPTVLYLHGNAGHIGYRMPLIRQLINVDMGVFILEYRGFGGNRGSPSEKNLYEDGETAMRFFNKQGVNPKKLIVYGESLGTGIATKLASKYQFCAVILQSPFTSLASVASYHYPWLFIKPWDKYNSLERIKLINAPLLILHGKRDQVVPYKEGLQLFNEANEPKQMFSFPDSGHNDLWHVDGFYAQVISFIQGHCS
jgi:fermentation-respiration switch protein FrsA (DUF1100 family)